MNFIKTMFLVAGVGFAISSCGNATSGQSAGSSEAGNFKYLIDEFADLKIIRYRVPGWDNLSLRQKEYIYHLSEAAKYGRDIIWSQNFRGNLAVRHALENIITTYGGDKTSKDFEAFMVYAKRVFFSNGIHHHYSEDKIIPECSKEYFRILLPYSGIGEGRMFRELVAAAGAGSGSAAASADKSATAGAASAAEADAFIELVYNPTIYPQRKYTGTSKDMLLASAVNFYEGVSKKEALDYYNNMRNPDDPTPISYGLNSRLVKSPDGRIYEDVYKIGGLYGPALEKIVAELEAAKAVAENEIQQSYITKLVEYYRSGDLRLWDEYNVEWVQDTRSDIDFVNGFVEDYNDPLGMKATWEAVVNFKNLEASKRTQTISDNAQWFEDHSPIDPRFKKKEVKGVSAKVITVACLGGDSYPSTAIGINLPNADWIRKDYGSKSVTIENITDGYAKAAEESPKSMIAEFAWDEEEIARAKKYGSLTDNLHTDLHECLGHGSGQLLPGTSPGVLAEYNSTLEESRADLFALYYLADPKLVELGILPDAEAYKAEYDGFIRNGIFTQFVRVELGKTNTQAHMQDRKLIAEWCYEQGKGKAGAGNIIEKRVRDGKTYFVITDYEALRNLFGKLLSEIQRIKSEGDYQAGKALVETYAVNIDYDLHKEVLTRYQSLQLKPYGGFINPEIVPFTSSSGKVIDYRLEYYDDYLQQMLDYGKKYATL